MGKQKYTRRSPQTTQETLRLFPSKMSLIYKQGYQPYLGIPSVILRDLGIITNPEKYLVTTTIT